MEQAIKRLKSIRNKIAARCGLYLGVALYSSLLLNYLCASSFPAIVSITSFLDCIYWGWFMFTAAMVYHKNSGAIGVNFVSILGVLLLCLTCTGFIFGALYFVQTVIIDPAYYSELSISIIRDNEILTNEQKDLAMEAYNTGSTSNPFIIIFSSVFKSLLFGILPSLILAAIINRRAPKQS